jgi:hypothetical protein
MNQDLPFEVAANRNDISRLAFQFWEQARCPEGRDLEFWLRAETQLLAPQRSEAVKVKPVAAKPSSGKESLRVHSNTARQPVTRF